jgi:hypothetical protein
MFLRVWWCNMQAIVTISDGDRNVDYTLQVGCDLLPGEAPRWGWRNGGEPGTSPAVEIHQVRCVELAVWCGPVAVSAYPSGNPRESLEKQIGAWCLDKYAEEIEQAVLESVVQCSPTFQVGRNR